MLATLRTTDDVHGRVINTVACTVTIKVPDTFAHRLNSLLLDNTPCVEWTIRNRDEARSKDYPTYPEIPCLVSKSLIITNTKTISTGERVERWTVSYGRRGG
jgi:hypothetical protein